MTFDPRYYVLVARLRGLDRARGLPLSEPACGATESAGWDSIRLGMASYAL